MCGIAGKVSAKGPVSEDLLHRMCSVIEPGGPDSRGVFAAMAAIYLATALVYRSRSPKQQRPRAQP